MVEAVLKLSCGSMTQTCCKRVTSVTLDEGDGPISSAFFPPFAPNSNGGHEYQGLK